MMPTLNYNSMDHRRSTDPGADESSEVTEHRYINLESFEIPDTDQKKSAQQSTPLKSGKTLPTRIAAYFRGVCDGGEESYDKLNSDSRGKSVYDARRNLGALGGVFAPVALGQLATNIFLRVAQLQRMLTR
ncbi:hypothetical protein ACOMHN_067477 [Nucella lapillus]